MGFCRSTIFVVVSQSFTNTDYDMAVLEAQNKRNIYKNFNQQMEQTVHISRKKNHLNTKQDDILMSKSVDTCK